MADNTWVTKDGQDAVTADGEPNGYSVDEAWKDYQKELENTCPKCHGTGKKKTA